jgi:hypothetical protein
MGRWCVRRRATKIYLYPGMKFFLLLFKECRKFQRAFVDNSRGYLLIDLF